VAKCGAPVPAKNKPSPPSPSRSAYMTIDRSAMFMQCTSGRMHRVRKYLSSFFFIFPRYGTSFIRCKLGKTS
jgi:hypothetical protein